MSRIWIVIGSILAVAALSWVTLVLVNVVAHEEVRRSEAFDAAAIVGVDVRNDNGVVEVVGDPDTDEVRIDAIVDHGLRRTSLEIDVVDGTLVVDGDCPIGLNIWCRVELRLLVPMTLPVEIDNGNGRLAVRDLSAGLAAHSSNGRVEVARITGPVDLSTSNGDIEARGLDSTSARATTSNGLVALTFATAPDVVDARTSNGRIEIVVPDDAVTYRIDADAASVGSVDTAVRTDPTSERTIAVRTSNGSITVRYPDG